MGLCCAIFETTSCACGLGRCLCTDGNVSTKCANGIYLFILITMTLLAFVLQEWGAPQFDFHSFNIGCTNIPGIDATACKGENAVYRISAGLAIWFAMIAIGNCCSRQLHTGLWGIKVATLLVVVIGFFFIPITGQDGYVQSARAIGALFLISQIIAFIDAAYHWNAFFVEKAYGGKEDVRWTTIILFICLVIGIGIVTCFVLLYVNYNHCTRQTVFTTLTLFLVVVVTLLQLHTHETESSLLTSCIVSAYAVYLCWSAVSSDSDECNPDHETEQQFACACLVTSISLAWTCYSTDTGIIEHGFSKLEDVEDKSKDEEGQDVKDNYTDEGGQGHHENQSLVLFHLVMATGSVYMSMLLTNWGTVSGHKSEAHMWVAIVSQWISMVIYVWSLVAPRCCPNREFE